MRAPLPYLNKVAIKKLLCFIHGVLVVRTFNIGGQPQQMPVRFDGVKAVLRDWDDQASAWSCRWPQDCKTINARC